MANQYNVKVTSANMKSLGTTRGTTIVNGSPKIVGNLISTLETYDLIGHSADGTLSDPNRIAATLQMDSTLYDALVDTPAGTNTYSAETAVDLIASVSGITVNKGGTYEYALGWAGTTISVSGEVVIMSFDDHTDIATVKYTDEVLSGFVQDSLANDVRVINALNLDLIRGTLTADLDLTFPYTDSGLTDEDNVKLYLYTGGQWVDQTGTLDTVSNTIALSTTTLGKFMVGEELAPPAPDVDEGYEGDTVGQVPATGVTIDVGNAICRVSDEEALSGSQSLKFASGTAWDHPGKTYYIQFPEDKRGVEIEWGFWLDYAAGSPQSNDTFFGLADTVGGTTYPAGDLVWNLVQQSWQHPLHDSNFRDRTSTPITIPGGAFLEKDWATFKIRWRGGSTADIFVDGDYKATMEIYHPALFKARQFLAFGSRGMDQEDFVDSIKVTYITPDKLVRVLDPLYNPTATQRLHNNLVDVHYNRTAASFGVIGAMFREVSDMGYLITSNPYGLWPRNAYEFDPDTDAFTFKLELSASGVNYSTMGDADGTALYWRPRIDDPGNQQSHKYDPIGNTNTPLNNFPIASWGSATVYDKAGGIYHVGGRHLSTNYNFNYLHTVSTDSYAAKANVPISGVVIANPAWESDGSKFWLLSGGQVSPETAVYEYDQSGDTWVLKAQKLPTATNSSSPLHAYRKGQDCYYMGGTEQWTGAPWNRADKYNIQTDSWTSITAYTGGTRWTSSGHGNNSTGII